VSVSDIATAAGTYHPSFILLRRRDIGGSCRRDGIEQITPEIEAILAQPLVRAARTQNKAIALLESYVNFSSQHHAILRISNLSADEGDKALRRSPESLPYRASTTCSSRDCRPKNGRTLKRRSAVLELMERIDRIARLQLRRHISRKV